MEIKFPFPSRYRRSRWLANLCRGFAVFFFILTIMISSGLTQIASRPDEGYLGDQISRVTSDYINVAIEVGVIVLAFLVFLNGTYLSLLLYSLGGTVAAAGRIERDVALIKRFVQAQVGERAPPAEIAALEEIEAAMLTIRPLRIAGAVGAVVVLCGALSVLGYLIQPDIPTEDAAPAFVVAEDCALGDGEDSDCDGISDELETWVAETFAPVYVYDSEEHNIVLATDDFQEFRDVIYFHQVSPAYCNTGGRRVDSSVESRGFDDNVSNDVLLTIVASYPYDYVPLGVADENETDVLDHFGDTERIRICLQRIQEESSDQQLDYEAVNADEAVIYRVAFVQINRHESFNTYEPRYSGLTWEDNTHAIVHVSEGKHATYTSQKECLAHPRNATALAYHEDCASLDDSDTIIRPTLVGLNVGQVGYQLIQSTADLTGPAESMFELSEELWLDTEFCGGYPPEELIALSQEQVQGFVAGANEQTLAVLDTILPFIDLQTGRVTEVCGSSLRSKWWVSSGVGG